MVAVSVIEDRIDEMVGLFSVGIENNEELEEHQPDDFRGESEDAETGSIGGS